MGIGERQAKIKETKSNYCKLKTSLTSKQSPQKFGLLQFKSHSKINDVMTQDNMTLIHHTPGVQKFIRLDPNTSYTIMKRSQILPTNSATTSSKSRKQYAIPIHHRCCRKKTIAPTTSDNSDKVYLYRQASKTFNGKDCIHLIMSLFQAES